MIEFDAVIMQTARHWLGFLTPNQRIYWVYLLSAFVLAFISYRSLRTRDTAEPPDTIKKGFWAYVFDKDIFFHASAQQDYRYFIFNGLIYYGIITQLLLSVHASVNIILHGLTSAFGPLSEPLFTVTPLSITIYTLVSAVFFDFAIFFLHWLHHRIPVLWQFHKVHHSAEVLTPITLYRMHPVDLFLTGLAVSVLTGFSFAGFFYLSDKEPELNTISNVNVIVFAFYLLGYNLRHSHIWLSFPPWLSHIFISPAQHQTHHSIDIKHFDHNMGLIFAFWDKLFGTLYVPQRYENLTYGLSKENPNPFTSTIDLYIKPFIDAYGVLKKNKNMKTTRFAIIGVFLILYTSIFIWERQGLADQWTLPSVHMEALTWSEIALAQSKGYDTVIIPTGGTEQNGPYVILGKHNYIIRYASGEIAKRLGKTLVAPVLSYVPEGDIDTREGHMAFSGTLSIPEKLFKQILESAAKSYKVHGFRKILFIGDSGGNQRAQQVVADKLSAAWKNKDMTVVHIGDYYSSNGQIKWLKSQGYSMKQIGRHAGMRDTSELMAVNPDGVRARAVPEAKGLRGSKGSRALSSAEIGRQMLELKIEAALKQIQAISP